MGFVLALFALIAYSLVTGFGINLICQGVKEENQAGIIMGGAIVMAELIVAFGITDWQGLLTI